jgi:hypothetical protein
MFEFVTEKEPTEGEATAMITSRGFEISPLIMMTINAASTYSPDKPRDQLVEMQKETKK